VAHADLKGLEPSKVATCSLARMVFDCVNGWNPDEWERAGFTFYRLGDGRRTSKGIQ